MIIDSLDNSSFYEKLNPLFKKAFDFLRETNLTSLENGRIELQGDDLFLIISDSSLKQKEDAKLEVHNQYIDIQVPVTKQESYGWSARSSLTHAIHEFDQEKDIQFFYDPVDSYFNLPPKHFVIFFPQDAHAPCIGEGVVKKIVVKVRNLE
ncbi:MAG: DUF386 domain-containing protein [Bacteroidales bacterium]|nr:DUF386 domain-containing protein [Bacteroidales bacterium]